MGKRNSKRLQWWCSRLGTVHKLRLQEEGGRWSKKSTFCKLFYHRKCKRRRVGGQKKTNLVNVVCERPLSQKSAKCVWISSFFKWKYQIGKSTFIFWLILLKLICFCVSDNLEIEDVKLKYKKRGGEVWVSLDQYK